MKSETAVLLRGSRLTRSVVYKELRECMPGKWDKAAVFPSMKRETDLLPDGRLMLNRGGNCDSVKCDPRKHWADCSNIRSVNDVNCINEMYSVMSSLDLYFCQ